MKLRILLALLLLVPAAAAVDVELLSTSPAPPAAGEYVDMTFLLYAESSEPVREGISFSLQDSPYIIQVSEPRVYSSLLPGQRVTLTLRAYISQAAPEGYLNVVTALSSSSGTSQTEHELFIEEESRAASLMIGKVRTTPAELLPDTEDNELVVTLQNLGEKDAELVEATLDVDSRSVRPAYAYALSDGVAEIEAGSQEDLTFSLDIEATAREPEPATLELRYRSRRDATDAYDIYELDLPFIIPIEESPYLEVVSYEPRTDFVAGSVENVLRVTVRNTGDEEAKDVRVRLFPDISVPFLFEQTGLYIGANVEPAETASFDVVFEITGEAQAREYPFTVEFESLVGSSRYAQEDEVVITVTQEASSSTESVGVYIVVTVLLAALIVGFLLWRRRRSQK